MFAIIGLFLVVTAVLCWLFSPGRYEYLHQEHLMTYTGLALIGVQVGIKMASLQ